MIQSDPRPLKSADGREPFATIYDKRSYAPMGKQGREMALESMDGFSQGTEDNVLVKQALEVLCRGYGVEVQKDVVGWVIC